MRIYPAFSPDGTKLAYTEFRRDKVLDVIEEIGVPLWLSKMKFKPVYEEDGADSFKPAWSRDGEQIAYTSNKAGNYDIWVLSLRDGKQKHLTRHPAYDGEPTWSPKGDEIAFVSTRTGSKELWVVSIVGDRLRQLTRLKSTVKEPCWIK